jgi:hypothetical protein
MIAPAKDPSPEPRWPALLAIVAAGLIFSALPSYLVIGPRWLLIFLIGLLELPAMIFLRIGFHRTNQFLGFIVSGMMTLFLLWSLGLLIVCIPSHKEEPLEMLRSGAVLWAANVIIFALWYWRLDGGGPSGRARRPGHTHGAFLFPQMTWEPTRGVWSPTFIDYLFLSFNTSTAFSPTDAPILSRWAKVLVMLQASISLLVIALLVARAINTI